MVTGALICEYNPFHNGHKYMLQMMREDGCECIVAVMSGSFTQRGDVAVFSKFQRAKTALKNGADMIIELPAVWAVSSAQRFARGGCDIIKALTKVNRVYFGSECGDIKKLRKTADATESEQVNEKVKAFMSEGDYYPVALQKAVQEIHGKEYADLLASPNNTLAVEYIKALKGSDIEVRTIKRTGVDHDSADTTDTIASASKIRSMINQNCSFDSFVPDSDAENPAFFEYAERALLLKLRELSASEFESIPDVCEGLHNRIFCAAREMNCVEEILTEIKTKRYTHSRLRRILTCALLGITKEHQSISTPYIRILGFNSVGEQFLKEIYSCATAPIVLNTARDAEKLTIKAKEIFDIDVKATDIRTVFEKSPTLCGADFTNGIIKN